MNKRRVKKLVVVCEIALHKSRKCGPTWLCYKMRAGIHRNELSVTAHSYV